MAIIKDRLTGKSRGFGFVEMSTDGEAMQAIEQLDGKDFKGRPLKINEARGARRRWVGRRLLARCRAALSALGDAIVSARITPARSVAATPA